MAEAEGKGFHKKAYLAKRLSINGKLGNAQPHRSSKLQPCCPECSGKRVWKDGFRYTKHGDIQRWLCRDCGLRFSESTLQPKIKVNVSGKVLKGSNHIADPGNVHAVDFFSSKKRLDNAAFPFSEDIRSQETAPPFISVTRKLLNTSHLNSKDWRVSASEREAKNMPEVETRHEKPMREGTEYTADVKGKILEFAWWMKKQGLSETTANLRVWFLRQIIEKGGDIYSPESVKAVIRNADTWDNTTKNLACKAYECFLKMLGHSWERPKYKEREKLPFIPLEQEIDTLISGCGKIMGTFLQLLKETAADPGELTGLKWTDINFQSKTVTINHPVKGHNARVLGISDTLVERLKMLPKRADGRLFSNYRTTHGSFQQQRRRLAYKLRNPRLLKIAFTTFRHWKATMEYHKTHDIYHVKKLLGHKRLTSTEIYINLEQAVFKTENDEFHVKAVKTLKEACKLVEVGFEKVDEIEGWHIYRKRK